VYYKKNRLLLLTILLFSAQSVSQSVDLYISPGIQVSYSNQLSVSYQLSTGIIADAAYPFVPAITVGRRYYFGKNTPPNMKRFNYIDVQTTAFFVGVGVGRVWNNQYGNFTKYKIYGGAFALLSYDRINFNNDINRNNHFGLFGVFPIPIKGSGLNIPLSAI